jgi:hypothetical protein
MPFDEDRRSSRGNSDVSEEGDRPLEHTWTWYYVEKSAHGKMTEEEYNKMLQPLGTFSTIKTFWEYWSNIMETKNFPDASTLYLFKEGIRPMWEDPQNIHGGKLQAMLPKTVSHQVWSDLVLSAIGEQLDSEDQVITDLGPICLSMIDSTLIFEAILRFAKFCPVSLKFSVNVRGHAFYN